MKKILIISPHFPPVNAPDMHRVRQNVNYLGEFGWEPTVICVNERYVETNKDDLLLKSIPINLSIIKVKAFSANWTRKFGLGALALRSLIFYFLKVNSLLRKQRFDLIFFSTSQFPVLILGRYWRLRFQIPFVIDMQDPWYTEYYENKPRSERPRKYWFFHRLNRFLEPIAMQHCDGLISVSQNYIDDLKGRYANLRNKPSKVITFGAFERDFKIAQENARNVIPAFYKGEGHLHLVYFGVVGYIMKDALKILFSSFKKGLAEYHELFSLFRFHFIGTSYAPKGAGKNSVIEIAKQIGVEDFVSEQTDRVPYFQVLTSLLIADGLVMPGSNDRGYTASKLYPYILAKKPILGIFHPESSAVSIIKECNAGEIITLSDSNASAYQTLLKFLSDVNKAKAPATNWINFEKYTAKSMTLHQVELFEMITSDNKRI